MEHPYAAVPPLSTHLRYAALAPAPAVALLRQEMSASAVDGRDGCAGGRRLERLSVMLWRGYGPTQSSAYVETCLCPTGVRVEFGQDRTFRALFWVMQRA